MSFQLVMTEVLRGINWKYALVYEDDIIIFSSNFTQHLELLDNVFTRLRKSNLKLKPSKCCFAAKSVKYLGHVVSKDGIQVDPQKTDAVQTFPVPKSKTDVKSFLGLCNYYRRFVKNFANIAAPLNALLGKDCKFQWSQECEVAFQMLKDCLTSAPVLAYPDMGKSFILSTDASGSAVSYIRSS